jgi:hypothetical protein
VVTIKRRWGAGRARDREARDTWGGGGRDSNAEREGGHEEREGVTVGGRSEERAGETWRQIRGERQRVAGAARILPAAP